MLRIDGRRLSIVVIAMALLAVWSPHLLASAVPMPNHAEESSIKVLLDGTEITFDQPPIIHEGRTLVPMRAIFEAMGAEVEWEAAFQTITGTKDATVVKMQIDTPIMRVNGESITLDISPQIVNGRTLVPARAVAESFSAQVVWNSEMQIVEIASPVISLEALQEKIPSSSEVTQEPSNEPEPVAASTVTASDGRSRDPQPVYRQTEIVYPEVPFAVGDSGLIVTELRTAQIAQGTGENAHQVLANISLMGELSDEARPLKTPSLKWQLKDSKSTVVQQGEYMLSIGNRDTLYPGRESLFYSWNDYSNPFEIDLSQQPVGGTYHFEIVGYGGEVIPEPITTFVLPKLPLTILYMDGIDYGVGWKLPGQAPVSIPPEVPIEQQTREYRTTHKLTITDIRVEQTLKYHDSFPGGEYVDIQLFASGYVDYVKSGKGVPTLRFDIEIKNDPESNPIYPDWYYEEPSEGALQLTEYGREQQRQSWQLRMDQVGYIVEDVVQNVAFTDVPLSKRPMAQRNEEQAYYIYPDDYVDPNFIVYDLLPGDAYYLTIIEREEIMEIQGR